MKKFWLIFLLPLILISCPKEEIAPEDDAGYTNLSGTIITYNFNVTGAEVCNYLTYIDEDYNNYDGTYTYSTDGVPICDDKSGINMKLYYQEE